MKISRYFLLAALLGLASTANAADRCDIHLLVTPTEQGDDVPEATVNSLMNRLERAVTATGVTADPEYGQFFVTGRFSHLYADVVPGPPVQHAIHTELTLYVGDLVSQKVYATQSFELRGVGTSEQRALINALGPIKANNKEFADFVERAEKKIVDYFDANYPQILNEARAAAGQHDYEKAIYLTSQVPTCSKGWKEANKAMLSYYQQYIDLQGTQLLMAARGEWAADPTAAGARAAWQYLALIDPESAAYSQAMKLADEMAATTKDDKMFETRQKYYDAVKTERLRIDAARQIGVAYGKGQQPTTTYINWIR